MASNYWCLSENDSEEEKAKEEASSVDYMELGGLTIPPWRVLQLMQMVEQNKTLELDSVGEIYEKKRQKKKKKKRRKNSKGGRGIEDVSETASEIRSTTGTSTTATDCRDMRRPGLLAYDDPELDDMPGLPVPKELFSRKRVLPPHKKLQLASLDKIAAEEHERRQRWKKAQDDSTSQLSSSTNHSSSSFSSGSIPVNSVKFAPAVINSVMTEAGSSTAQSGNDHHKDEDVLSFGEESDDADDQEEELPYGNRDKNYALPFMTGKMEDSSISDSGIKLSLLSQINRVEKLLDSDGLT